MSKSQLDAIHSLIRAINSCDVEGIASLLSEDATHRYMPSTMGPEAVGVRDKAGTLAVFKGTFENVVQHMGVSTQSVGFAPLSCAVLNGDTFLDRDQRDHPRAGPSRDSGASTERLLRRLGFMTQEQIDDNGVRKDGTSYFVEYIMFIRFTPGTDKIASIVEFQDSLYVSREFAGWYDKASKL